MMSEESVEGPSAIDLLERERKFLAEELHEGLCQNLCGISIHLKVLERRITEQAPAFGNEFTALQSTLDETIDQTRFLYRSLKPPLSSGAALAEAIGELAKSKGGSLECEESYFDDSERMSAGTAVGFFRIAQEVIRDAELKGSAGIRIFLQSDEGSVRMRIEGLPDVTDTTLLHVIQMQAAQIVAELNVTPNRSLKCRVSIKENPAEGRP